MVPYDLNFGDADKEFSVEFTEKVDASREYYDSGYAAGNEAGYAAGHDAGYTEGEQDGYKNGFTDGVNSVEETDPNVPDWAKQPEKPKYTADEVGAQPANENLVQMSGGSLVTMGGVSIDGGMKCAMGAYTGAGKYLVSDPSELSTYPDNANLLSFDFIPLMVDVFGDRRCTFRLKEAGVTYIQPAKKNIRPFTPTVDGVVEDSWGDPQVTNHFAYGIKPVVSTWVTYDDDNIYYAYRAKARGVSFSTNLKAVVYIDKANDGVVGNNHGSGADGDMVGWWYYSSGGIGRWMDYSASWDGTYLKKDGREFASTYKAYGNDYLFEGELKIPRTSLPFVNAAIESGEEGRIPVRIGFYNAGEAYWTSTKDEAARIPAVGEVTYATPTIDGGVEGVWGVPQSVTMPQNNTTAPKLSTWIAVDDDNIYYAYRAEVKSVTFGTNLKALVYIDKANDGKAGWSHGSGSTGDKIGWWYYPSVGNGFWQDYSASWDGTYLKTDGRQVASTVKLVNGVYVFEGELKIPRTSAPYIDAAFKSGVEGKLPFRIEFMNGSAYATDETQVATIPACPFVRELAYEANVVRDGENSVYPLANKLIYNKDGGAAYLVWAMDASSVSKGAELQLNKANTIYHYTAFGIDVKTLYKQNGW